MTDSLSADEVEALLPERGRGARPRAIAPRDFRQPHRLHAGALAALRRSASRSLRDVGAALAGWLREAPRLELLDVGEVDVEPVLGGLAEPLCVLQFRCAGQPGWLVWERAAAVAAAEAALGRRREEDEDDDDETGERAAAANRALTPIEQRLLERCLGAAARALTAPWSVDCDAFQLVQSPEQLDSWADAPRAEPRRVFAHVALEVAGAASTLRLFVPGARAPELAAPVAADERALPAHLDDVPMEVGAHLGTVEIPLRDLLQLETGDVVPLGVRRDAPLDLVVEGRACATAYWGALDGRLAVRVHALGASRRSAEDA